MTKANPDEITVHDGPEPFEARYVRPTWITGSLSVVEVGGTPSRFSSKRDRTIQLHPACPRSTTTSTPRSAE